MRSQLQACILRFREASEALEKPYEIPSLKTQRISLSSYVGPTLLSARRPFGDNGPMPTKGRVLGVLVVFHSASMACFCRGKLGGFS